LFFWSASGKKVQVPCVDRLRIWTDKSLAGTTIFTAD
jgi:hypothetical protein